MSDLDLAAVKADLTRDEELRLFCYDDGDGKPVVPGKVMIGHPTIGVGRALDVRGITGPEAAVLLQDDVHDADAALAGKFGWYADLDPVRKRVLLECCFNMGIGHLVQFHNMLEALEQEDYARASAEMICSAWYRQVGKRATRLATMMRTGEGANV